MKTILLVLLFILPVMVFAQPNLPRNEEGKIVYSGTVETNTRKDEIYRRLHSFYLKNLKIENSLLQEEDSKSHIIIGKACQEIKIGPGIQARRLKLWYTIEVLISEGSLSYTISDVMLQRYCEFNLMVPCKTQTKPVKIEYILDSSRRKNEFGDDRGGYKQLEFETDKAITYFINSTKNHAAY